MKKENVSKVLMRKIFDYAAEKDVDLNVAFVQHENLKGTFAPDVYEATRDYVLENYKELCEARKTDPEFSSWKID